ncbi:hypothetical protein Tco_0072926 [Tanacetum coccineum]
MRFLTIRETGVDQPLLHMMQMKTKGRGMRIPKWLLTEEMKQTKDYKPPRLPNPQEQQGESSAPKKPIIFRILKRKQPDPKTTIHTAEQIDITNLDEATQVSIATANIIEGYEAQQAVKKVDEHLIDANIKNQEDLDTRIDPKSHKESPEAKKVAEIVSVDENVEEELAEVALIRRKGKGSLEIKDTPLATPTRSPRTITDSLSLDKEKL